MLLITTILFLFFELLILASITLFFHRLIPGLGLLPFAFLMGGLAAIVQYDMVGVITIPIGNGSAQVFLSAASFSILPVILLGMLLVYAIQGTLPARTLLTGIILTIAVTALTQIFVALPHGLPGWAGNIPINGRVDIRQMLASALTLCLDQVILVIVYQWSCNRRGSVPSRIAGMLALMGTLWADGLLFPLLSSPGQPLFTAGLVTHMLGNTLAGAALCPLIFFYFQAAPALFPNSAVSTHRPVWDIFASLRQLEARERFHYTLLHTLSQINQLIMRTDNADELFRLVCERLAANRDYLLVWVGLLDDKQQQIHLAAHAGPGSSLAHSLSIPQHFLSPELGPVGQVVTSHQAVIQRNILHSAEFPAWRTASLNGGCQAYAALPMCSGEELLGTLVVYASQPGVFDVEEVGMLQELANDLAYATHRLEARRQQMILLAAAETMPDGLVVTDLSGTMAYVNLTAAQMIGKTAPELIGQNLDSLSNMDEKVMAAYRQALISQGYLNIEFETPSPRGDMRFISVNASVAYNENGEPHHLVASIKDITRRRQFEHQLFSLNRLITELVQIRNPENLLETLLQASEEMLKANASGIYLVGADGNQIVQTVSNNLPTEYTQRIAKDYQGLPGDTVRRTRQTVAIRDVLSDPIYQERIHFMADYNIHALLLLPVIFQEHAFGVLVTYYHQPHDFTEEEMQLGQTLSHTIAITLQNARLYQAEHSQRELAEALSQAAIRLNRSLNLDEVLDLVLEQTLRVAACRSANILLVEGKAAYLARRHGYFKEAPSIQETIPFPLTLYTLQCMIQTQQPITIHDVLQDPHWYPVEGTHWIRSYAGAPLIDSNNQIIGFLNVDSDQPGFFTEETAHRLQVLAAHGAMAIQNARLYQQLRQYASELEERVRLRTKELQTAKERIEAILSSVPDAVFVLDEYYQPIQANQSGEALLEQAHNQDVDLFDAAIIAKLAASETPSEKTIIQVQERSYQPLASQLAIEGRPSGLVVVFRNVTRFRELDQMKTQFVSDVSHELRTPLTNMTIYLDLLTAVQDAEKRRGYLETLRRETGRLTHLIEDLLTISRLEAGRVQVNIKPIDANQLIADLAQDRRLMAANRGLTLHCEPFATAATALADPMLLTQCVSNLLTNAINYTPSGGIIWLRTLPQDSAGRPGLVIVIQDTGVGISAEEIPLIFGRFYRGSASRQTGAAGTGLGLAISKEIIERMNGYIHAESTPGQGSAFTIWLPTVL